MALGGPESEIALGEGMKIYIIDQGVSIDDIERTAIAAFQMDAIPVVGFDQMSLISVFSDNGRMGLPVVAAEAARGVAVAAVAEIVERHG